MDGPNGISSYVLKAEQSKSSVAKAKFHEAMREVAELRKVGVEEVYESTWTLGVVEDMIKNGVTDPTTYALLGITDDTVKAAVKRAEGNPSKPVVRPKPFSVPVQSEVSVKRPMSVGRVISDAAYGVARVVGGRKPANILSNRLNKVNGERGKRGPSYARSWHVGNRRVYEKPVCNAKFPVVDGRVLPLHVHQLNGEERWSKMGA